MNATADGTPSNRRLHTVEDLDEVQLKLYNAFSDPDLKQVYLETLGTKKFTVANFDEKADRLASRAKVYNAIVEGFSAAAKALREVEAQVRVGQDVNLVEAYRLPEIEGVAGIRIANVRTKHKDNTSTASAVNDASIDLDDNLSAIHSSVDSATDPDEDWAAINEAAAA